jgi:F0F1-type ATP synthase assembly protein I
MGMELAGAIVGLTLVGLWIDHRFGTGPKGVLICAGVGIVGGFYNFIRQALEISRPDSTRRRRGNTDSKRDADRDSL